MWKTYFKFVKLEPGRVVTALFGELDFSADDIGIEIIKALYESGFPYLEITEEVKNELYGTVSKMERVDLIVKPLRSKK
jgi:hypothetical protein